MPADRTITLAPARAPTDGLVLAPADPGPWSALRELRAAMRDLRRRGVPLSVEYVYAISRRGRLVGGRNTDAAVLVLAYRLARRTRPARERTGHRQR